MVCHNDFFSLQSKSLLQELFLFIFFYIIAEVLQLGAKFILI